MAKTSLPCSPAGAPGGSAETNGFGRLGFPQLGFGRFALAGLIALLCFEFGLAIDWQTRDQEQLYWDAADHAGRTLKVQHALWRSEPPVRGNLLPDSLRSVALEHPRLARLVTAPVAGFANLVDAFYRGPVRPPLSYLPAGVVLGLIGTSPDAIALAHGLLWFLVLISGSYFLAARTIGASGGLLAAILTAGTPLFLGQSQLPMLDVPLAAVTVYAVWALVECDGFRNRRASLLLGVCCGAGMLAKQSFVVAMLGPLLFEGYVLLRSGGLEPARRNHALQALFVALLVAGPWYAAYLPSTLRFIAFSASQGAVEGDPSSLSLAGLLFYPRSFVVYSLGPVLSGVAAISLVVLLFARNERLRAPILLAISSLFVVFALVHPNKDPRYLAPALPLLAVAIACAVAKIRIPSLRRATGVALAGCALIATLHLQLPQQSAEPGGVEAASRLPDWFVARFDRWFDAAAFGPRSIYAYPPRARDWHHPRVLEAIREDRGTAPGIAKLFVLEDAPGYADHLSVLSYPVWLRARDGVPVQALRIVHERHGAPPDDHFYSLLVWRRDDGHPEGWRPLVQRAGLDTVRMRSLLRLSDLPDNLELALFHSSRVAAGDGTP